MPKIGLSDTLHPQRIFCIFFVEIAASKASLLGGRAIFRSSFSMKMRLPTRQEVEKLVSFLPRLYADGFTPIRRWAGGTKDKNGVITLSWPEYEKDVEDFFRAASGKNWVDYAYRPDSANRMLEIEDFIKTADLGQIKTMLTFCVRGERFCDGHWGAMIERGHIRRLLQRLAEIGSKMT